MEAYDKLIGLYKGLIALSYIIRVNNVLMPDYVTGSVCSFCIRE